MKQNNAAICTKEKRMKNFEYALMLIKAGKLEGARDILVEMKLVAIS